ncbi:hypothetical protein GDO86_013578 [Hymenochirus boettgeri]|uniref:G-protein coupled receptors family 1 profile domain-containing protein n=1 Tax=Hymenochirus boettgeri TaxID=247094 RepID=A0A8T2IRZ4_9PIPI|nr:hypothetical protein GDO86_013578 [Hymenochirus boettgeri]
MGSLIYDRENPGNVSEFSIQGFSDVPGLQLPLFVLFLGTYLAILMGNLTIFIVITFSSHLHTPMYIFLLNLALMDVSFATDILPNLLYMVFTNQRTISFSGCLSQMYLFISLVTHEYLLLAIMAYDRYIAICDPLHYITRMNLKHCAWLIAAVWLTGFLVTSGHPVLISKLSYCSSHLVTYIFCDVTPLLQLSCSDTFYVQMLTYIDGALLAVNSFLLTLTSYIFILSTILRIRTTEGRQKAFYTCSSHLISVAMFYILAVCLYIKPTRIYSPFRDRIVGILYVVLIPMLNPLIYTLKNREFQSAFKKLMQTFNLIIFHKQH